MQSIQSILILSNEGVNVLTATLESISNVTIDNQSEKYQFIELMKRLEILKIKFNENIVMIETSDRFIFYKNCDIKYNDKSNMNNTNFIDNIFTFPKSLFNSKYSFFDINITTVDFNFLNRKPTFVFYNDNSNDSYFIKKIKSITTNISRGLFSIFIGNENFPFNRKLFFLFNSIFPIYSQTL